MAIEGDFFKHQRVCLKVGNIQGMMLVGVSKLNFKTNTFSNCPLM